MQPGLSLLFVVLSDKTGNLATRPIAHGFILKKFTWFGPLERYVHGGGLFQVLLAELLDFKSPTCADPESFVRGGPNLMFSFFSFFFFLAVEGLDDPNITINGPSSACQRNAIEMAFRWRADDGPTLNASLVALCQGIRTSIAQKSYCGAADYISCRQLVDMKPSDSQVPYQHMTMNRK